MGELDNNDQIEEYMESENPCRVKLVSDGSKNEGHTVHRRRISTTTRISIRQKFMLQDHIETRQTK